MDNYVKIIFAGDSNCGKTTLLLYYIMGEVKGEAKPTVAASFFTRTIDLNNKKYNLVLWDTAGQELYRNLTPMYYRDSKIAFILFDVTSKTSFDNLESWVRDIRNEAGDGVLLSIVGNKIDLDDRVISQVQATDYALSIGAQYFETSAITGEGVNEMIQCSLEEYIPLIETSSKTLSLTENKKKNDCC